MSNSLPHAGKSSIELSLSIHAFGYKPHNTSKGKGADLVIVALAGSIDADVALANTPCVRRLVGIPRGLIPVADFLVAVVSMLAQSSRRTADQTEALSVVGLALLEALTMRCECAELSATVHDCPQRCPTVI